MSRTSSPAQIPSISAASNLSLEGGFGASSSSSSSFSRNEEIIKGFETIQAQMRKALNGNPSEPLQLAESTIKTLKASRPKVEESEIKDQLGDNSATPKIISLRSQLHHATQKHSALLQRGVSLNEAVLRKLDRFFPYVGESIALSKAKDRCASSNHLAEFGTIEALTEYYQNENLPVTITSYTTTSALVHVLHISIKNAFSLTLALRGILNDAFLEKLVIEKSSPAKEKSPLHKALDEQLHVAWSRCVALMPVGTPLPALLRHFMGVLESYQSLYTAPCARCGRILAFDSSEGALLPPVVRHHLTFDAYHRACAPLV